MRSFKWILLVCLIVLSVPLVTAQDAGLTYPEARATDHVDTLHGVEVADPYRWMEDLDSEELATWVKAQSELAFDYLRNIPEWQGIRDRVEELWNYEKISAPSRKANRYFFRRNDGLQNQSVTYWQDGLDGEPKILFDPNTWSEDGTVALKTSRVSEDGKYVAYGISKSGSDLVEFRGREIASGEILEDHIQHVKFSSPSWDAASQGFYYGRYPEGDLADANKGQKLYYHRVGTPQSEDFVVYERPEEPDQRFSGGETDDGQYFLLYVSGQKRSANQLYIKDLKTEGAEYIPLFEKFDARYWYLAHEGTRVWIQTDFEAPNMRVVSFDISDPSPERWTEIIPEKPEALRGISVLNNQLVARYLKDAYSQVKIYDLEGKHVRDVDLPGIGTVYGFNGKREDTKTFITYTSYTTPADIYEYDMVSGERTLWRRPDVKFDPDRYTTNQVFFESKDGTKVPMFLTHRKDLTLDGSNPAYMYGYGGFNSPMTPGFSLTSVVWMEMGGVYAVVCCRGGGEYGKAWHDAGSRREKQNTFDDFIGAAEWLIAEKYTSSPKLAIAGGSNGGLLVGACMTQRPELFGACLPAVGVMDMLRFHKFTIGGAWRPDYGDPDDPDDFKVLYSYSPYHNLKPGTTYPSTMVSTADHDDRVVPSHSFKFAARLQACHAGDNPVICRIETKAGHGAGMPTSKRIDSVADRWAFLVKVLNIEVESEKK
jgi:prolyl oligopeptidase